MLQNLPTMPFTLNKFRSLYRTPLQCSIYHIKTCFSHILKYIRSVCIFLFSVLQEKQIKNVVFELMTVNSELKTLVLWYQMLEAEAVSAEAWTTFLVEEPCCESVKEYTQSKTMKKRHKIFWSSYSKMATTMELGYKSSLYTNWLRETALYTITKVA